MKIKDLSSSNQVAGEGILCWSLQDVNGNTTYIERLDYHIPNAEVHLLSPQVLLKTIGGHALQNDEEIAIDLDNSLIFCAQYCPTSNLPLKPIALQAHSKLVSGPPHLVLQLMGFVRSMPSKLSFINPIQTCRLLRRSSFFGINRYLMLQLIGFGP
jgi:hypothetical protein